METHSPEIEGASSIEAQRLENPEQPHKKLVHPTETGLYAINSEEKTPNAFEEETCAEMKHILKLQEMASIKDDEDDEEEMPMKTTEKETTPSNQNSILLHLEESIQKLPLEERQAYETVKAQAPELIEKESPPLLFLKRHQFNTEKAAVRLATYWKLRFQAFPTAALSNLLKTTSPQEPRSDPLPMTNPLLPLHQTGEGALSRNALALLSNGYYAILPPSTDQHRTIILLDYSRIVKDDLLARIQLEFYFHQCILQNPKSQAPMILFVLSPECNFILQKYTHSTTPSGDYLLLQSLVAKAFAFKVHSIHYCYKNAAHAERLQKYLPAILQQTANIWNVTAAQQHVHEPPAVSKLEPPTTKSNDRNDDVATNHDFTSLHAALVPFGITKLSQLPQMLGGTWSYERFITWQELRIRVEWELPLGVLDQLEYGEAYQAKPLGHLSPDEQVERKRRYNILHSRRKRRRDRVEYDVVKRQMEQLQNMQQAAKREERRLKDLLERAKRMAHLVSSGMVASDAAYIDPALLNQDLSSVSHRKGGTGAKKEVPLPLPPPIEDNKDEKWASALAASSRLRELQLQEAAVIRYRQQQDQQHEQQHHVPSFLSATESLYPGMSSLAANTNHAGADASTAAYLYQRQQQEQQYAAELAAHNRSLVAASALPSPYLSHLLSQAPSAPVFHASPVASFHPASTHHALYDPRPLAVAQDAITQQQQQVHNSQALQHRLLELRLQQDEQDRRNMYRFYGGGNF